MTNPNEVSQDEAVALFRKHELFLYPMQPGQMAAMLNDFLLSRTSATSDAADAARYRWLRDENNWTEDGLCPIIANGEDTIYGEFLDKSIDYRLAAIAAGGATP